MPKNSCFDNTFYHLHLWQYLVLFQNRYFVAIFSLHSIRCFFHQKMMFSINKGKYLGKQKFGWELILDWWFRICSFRGIDSTGEHNYVKHIGQSFDFFVSFVTPIYSRRNNQSKSCFFVQLWQMLLPHNTALLKNDYFSLCF